MTTTVERVLARVATQAATAVLLVGTAVVGALWIEAGLERSVFAVGRFERHFYEAGTLAATRLPRAAAVVTVKNSGSVRYYAERPIVTWNMLPGDGLEAALRFLAARGYEPYLLFEVEEEEEFRKRFRGASPLGELDWPPAAQVGRTIRVYNPADRERFLSDGKVRTEFVTIPPPSPWRSSRNQGGG
jgi:hypothetical protein